MDTNWEASLAAVLKSEGGNDDDPADHGGRTSRGITQREYDAWCVENREPKGDVWAAPQAFIESIYHEEYWSPLCPILPVGPDYMLFDMNVNAGPREAVVLIQRALGVTADGRVGAITRQAMRAADPPLLAQRFTIMKIAFYRSLHQPKFINGWLNRARAVEVTALAMIQKGAASV